MLTSLADFSLLGLARGLESRSNFTEIYRLSYISQSEIHVKAPTRTVELNLGLCTSSAYLHSVKHCSYTVYLLFWFLPTSMTMDVTRYL